MMTLLRYCLTSLFLFVSLQHLTAQDRDNYSLLWEVVNPNTGETSYVFGTMHLSDPKVFQFSDQVLTGIQNTEAFATEVHPDSLESGMLKSLAQEGAVARYKEVLTKKEYKRLDKRIIEITGVSLDELKYNSLDFIEILLRPDISKDDDEVTFLDDFLHKAALVEGKKLNGLEQIEDQLTYMYELTDEDIRESINYMLDGNEQEYKYELSKFIDIYYTGDIDKIYEKVLDSKSRQLDDLNSRNRVMANSIEEITNQNTLFAAIGAAHLPGKEGVLELLKNKGFAVKKAIATFNNKSNVEIVSQRSLNGWKTYQYDKLGYTVLAPDNPKESLRSKMTGSLTVGEDPINNISVTHSSLEIQKDRFKTNEQLIDTLLTTYNTKSDQYDYKMDPSLKKEDNHYVIMATTDGDDLQRIDVYVKNKRLYFFVAVYTKDLMSIKGADKFFNSIKIFEPITNSNEWIVLEEEIGAYKVEIPKEYKKLNHEIPNPMEINGDPWVLNFYYATNKEENEQYLVRYNDFPLGYFLEDMELSVDEYIENIKGKKATIISKEKKNINGLTTYDIELTFYETFHSRLRIIFRGNRIYLLLAQSMDKNKKMPLSNRAFNSFEFLDYKKDNYETINTNGKYTFKLPKINRVDVDSSNYNQADLAYNKTYQGLDEYTGNVFTLTQNKLGKYYKTDDKDAYLKEYTDLIIGEDSVINRIPFNNGIIAGTELLLDVTKSDLQQRFRIFYYDDNLFLMGSYQDPSKIYNDNSEEFFNSFKPLSKSNFDPEASKSDLLFKDLARDDQDAIDALDYYLFDKNDHKKLIELINKSYPSDTLYYGKRNMMIAGLALIQDESTIKDLKTLYESTTNDKVKARIIESLLFYESTTATQLSFDLLKKGVPKVPNNELFYLKYDNDSLIDIKTYGNQIWELQSDGDLRGKTLNYYKRNLDDNEAVQDFLNQRSEELINWFIKDIESLKTEEAEAKMLSNYQVQSYIDIFEKLKIYDDKVLKTVKNYITQKPMTTSLHQSGFNYYVNHSDDIDKETVEEYMKPLYYRFEAMESLAQANQINLIPKSYLNDKEFSHVSVFNAVFDYDENMIIKHLGKLKIEDMTYIVFQFNYSNAEEKVDYIAIARVAEIDMNAPEQFDVWLSNDGIKNGDWKKLARKEIKDWNTSE